MSTVLDPPTRTRLEARIRRLRPDSPRHWGRMTPHQAICHLSDAFTMALKEREVTPREFRLRRLVKFVALRLPLAWPRGRLQTVPEADQAKGGTPPGEFERDRDRLLELLQRFAGSTPSQLLQSHPMFGRMTQGDWGRWGYRHLDHHLRQFGV